MTRRLDRMQTPKVDRHIRLDGCVNFRDAGGYMITTARPAGPGTGVRWRKLFRSDALNQLTAADVALLIDDLRVTTVVDLRTGFERQRDADRPLDRAGAQVVHAPLLTERNASSVEEPGLTLSQRYVRMLEQAGEPLVRAISAVAGAQGGVIVHCAAGKDRTGLIVAAILGTLGVGEDDIVADYTLTTENLVRIEQRLEQDAEVHGYVPGKVMAAPAAAMREVLAVLRGRYGSMAAFLDHAGVGADVMRRLHSALVVPLDDMVGGKAMSFRTSSYGQSFEPFYEPGAGAAHAAPSRARSTDTSADGSMDSSAAGRADGGANRGESSRDHQMGV